MMAAIDLLYKDLELAYTRHHQDSHIYFMDGEVIEFKDCSLWQCKNYREKLAEWRLTLDEAVGIATGDL
jgi:hypothetical protein